MKQQNKDYSYFSFESAKIDLKTMNIRLNIISDYWIIKNFEKIGAQNIKLLPDIDDKEIKNIDNFKQLQNLKLFFDENQFEFEDDHYIFQ